MATRKRSGSSTKRPKEKVVFIYETLFKGEDYGRENEEFWNEFFLLLPNVEVLENQIINLNSENISLVRQNINELFTEAIKILETDSPKRVINALQTLSVLIIAVFKKSSTSESGFDIINTLIGFEEADEKIKKLVNSCNFLLQNDSADATKNMCLKLLLSLATGEDILNKNIFLEYVMINSLFESLVCLLRDPLLRNSFGHDAVILLALLVNYRKNEGANPYVVQLSILADELALNGYGQVISLSLIDYCKQYALTLSEAQAGGGWFTSLSNIVGNIFVSDEDGEKMQQIRAHNGLLLGFYEGVHLNRSFISCQAHTQNDTSSPPSPSNTLAAGNTPSLSEQPPLIDLNQYPTNLFMALFQYCSIIMQDNKNESSMSNFKLCLIILTCIAEDHVANSIMFDANLTFKIYLHRATMRHRKLPTEKVIKPQPLAATLFDLLIEYIISHLLKKFPMETYQLTIGVIVRLITYAKRCRIRLQYNWNNLWSALISLLKFVVYHEQHLVKKVNIFTLMLQVINIFNLFITYGDTFLATTTSYDALYYELNREEKIFSEIHALVLRYTTTDNIYKEDVIKLLNSLVNILAIIKHFQIKIKDFLATQHLSTPTEEQILEIVRKNYDLTLKLHDSLDHFERYSESPNHVAFFNSIVKEVVLDTRKNVYQEITKNQHHNVEFIKSEYQSISIE